MVQRANSKFAGLITYRFDSCHAYHRLVNRALHIRSFCVTVYHNEKQRGFNPEREHGLTYPEENGRMPTDIGADSLLVAQRRQPEVIYNLHIDHTDVN